MNPSDNEWYHSGYLGYQSVFMAYRFMKGRYIKIKVIPNGYERDSRLQILERMLRMRQPWSARIWHHVSQKEIGLYPKVFFKPLNIKTCMIRIVNDFLIFDWS